MSHIAPCQLEVDHVRRYKFIAINNMLVAKQCVCS